MVHCYKKGGSVKNVAVLYSVGTPLVVGCCKYLHMYVS
jgi:hypothetical protein